MGILLKKGFSHINQSQSALRKKALEVLELAKKQEAEKLEKKKKNIP
mgnify:CR=1 FL=1